MHKKCAESMGMSETSRNFLFQPSLGAAGEAEALPHSMKICLEFSWGTQHKQRDNKSKARRVFCWVFFYCFFFSGSSLSSWPCSRLQSHSQTGKFILFGREAGAQHCSGALQCKCGGCLLKEHFFNSGFALQQVAGGSAVSHDEG